MKNEPIHADDSILNSEWVAPSRPYSNKELQHRHERFFKSLRLSSLYVCHSGCGHKYFVKENGVKYKGLQDEENEGSLDIGKCSVCWKLRQTPRSIKGYALDFLDLYDEYFPSLDNIEFSYYTFEIERIFYTWLYQENF